jgi:hypothetical protein
VLTPCKKGRPQRGPIQNRNRGQACDSCRSKALAPRSFNNKTVASDRDLQIASLTPVSSLGGSIKDDESIAAANENGIAMSFTRPRPMPTPTLSSRSNSRYGKHGRHTTPKSSTS